MISRRNELGLMTELELGEAFPFRVADDGYGSVLITGVETRKFP